MFLLGGKKLTQWSITTTRNSVQAFWGTIRGSDLFFFQQCAGKTASSLANFWLERASQLCFLLSSHNYPNTGLLVAPMCSIYQATWTCIWSAGVCRPVNSTARWMCINNGVLCVKITSGEWWLWRQLWSIESCIMGEWSEWMAEWGNGNSRQSEGKINYGALLFQSVLHCAPLPVLIDKLHNSL